MLLAAFITLAYRWRVFRTKVYGRDLRTKWDIIKEIAINVPWALIVLFVIPCVMLKDVIPKRFKRRIIVSLRRSQLKWNSGRLDDKYAAIAKEDLDRDSPSRRYVEGRDARPSPALQRLMIDDILFLIIQELDYADAVNLARTSKWFRERIYFSREQRFVDGDRLLRSQTCPGAAKWDCWVCGAQVCNENVRLYNPYRGV